MADQINAIIKLRRGSDSERRLTTFESGEIVYSTDNKRIFIGDGTTLGGSLIGNQNTIGTNPSPYAINKDLFFNNDTNTLWMLSSEAGPDNIDNYAKITPTVDGVTLKNNNNVFSINSDFLNDNDSGYLKLSGGTMKGYITLHSDPISAKHAATKEYIDTKIDNIDVGTNKFVKLSGDTITGKLTILSSFEVSNKTTIGGGLDVIGNCDISGDVNLNGNKFLNFRPEVKSVTLTLPISTYTLLSEDNGSILVLSGNGTACKVYCPEDFPIGYNVMIIQQSNASVYVLPELNTTVTVNQIDGYNIIRKKYGVCNMVVVDNNTYVLAGDLS